MPYDFGVALAAKLTTSEVRPRIRKSLRARGSERSYDREGVVVPILPWRIYLTEY